MSNTTLDSPIFGSLVPLPEMTFGVAIYSLFVQASTLGVALYTLWKSPAFRTRLNGTLILNAIAALTFNIVFLTNNYEYRFVYASNCLTIFTQLILMYVLLSKKFPFSSITLFSILILILMGAYSYVPIVLPSPINTISMMIVWGPVVYLYFFVIARLTRSSWSRIEDHEFADAGNQEKARSRAKGMFWTLIVGAFLLVFSFILTVIFPNTIISVTFAQLTYSAAYGMSMVFVIFQKPDCPVAYGKGSDLFVFIAVFVSLVLTALSLIPNYFINGNFGGVRLY